MQDNELELVAKALAPLVQLCDARLCLGVQLALQLAAQHEHIEVHVPLIVHLPLLVARRQQVKHLLRVRHERAIRARRERQVGRALVRVEHRLEVRQQLALSAGRVHRLDGLVVVPRDLKDVAVVRVVREVREVPRDRHVVPRVLHEVGVLQRGGAHLVVDEAVVRVGRAGQRRLGEEARLPCDLQARVDLLVGEDAQALEALGAKVLPVRGRQREHLEHLVGQAAKVLSKQVDHVLGDATFVAGAGRVAPLYNVTVKL